MLELHRYGTALLHVFALIPVFSKADVAILCEDCNGRRWLLCDFCKGQKTNIAEPLERGLAEDIENDVDCGHSVTSNIMVVAVEQSFVLTRRINDFTKKKKPLML
ncbi:hypothetical protein D8674_036991 [Pyrus ussuriensis x Pyrus communis]|uniref:Uncharacterized protein n=1 Tax=Pyrus ussuriensis x Pyrus communis TaxID=2448454 RepID=A0A5N5H1I0_9ROSA|nr:hypothetical protein D8674_036991 [Pyrus ussuriensis x Pyrus communis]